MIATLQMEKQKAMEESKTQIDALHTALNETKSSLVLSSNKINQMEAAKSDLDTKLSTIKQEQSKVESALQEKVRKVVVLAIP